MREYNWPEVLKIQDGKGNKVCLPSINEYGSDERFILTEITLTEINTELLSTLDDFRKYDCYEDYKAVENLIKAYRNKEDVPPIVIGKDREIIEGYHRIPAMLELNKKTFKAFKQVK